MTLDDPVATGGTSGNGIDDAGDVVGAIVRNGERYGFLLRDGMYMTINARQESDAQRTGCPPPGALCRVPGDGCRVPGAGGTVRKGIRPARHRRVRFTAR